MSYRVVTLAISRLLLCMLCSPLHFLCCSDLSHCFRFFYCIASPFFLLSLFSLSIFFSVFLFLSFFIHLLIFVVSIRIIWPDQFNYLFSILAIIGSCLVIFCIVSLFISSTFVSPPTHFLKCFINIVFVYSISGVLRSKKRQAAFEPFGHHLLYILSLGDQLL